MNIYVCILCFVYYTWSLLLTHFRTRPIISISRAGPYRSVRSTVSRLSRDSQTRDLRRGEPILWGRRRHSPSRVRPAAHPSFSRNAKFSAYNTRRAGRNDRKPILEINHEGPNTHRLITVNYSFGVVFTSANLAPYF